MSRHLDRLQPHRLRPGSVMRSTAEAFPIPCIPEKPVMRSTARQLHRDTRHAWHGRVSGAADAWAGAEPEASQPPPPPHKQLNGVDAISQAYMGKNKECLDGWSCSAMFELKFSRYGLRMAGRVSQPSPSIRACSRFFDPFPLLRLGDFLCEGSLGERRSARRGRPAKHGEEKGSNGLESCYCPSLFHPLG